MPSDEVTNVSRRHAEWKARVAATNSIAQSAVMREMPVERVRTVVEREQPTV